MMQLTLTSADFEAGPPAPQGVGSVDWRALPLRVDLSLCRVQTAPGSAATQPRLPLNPAFRQASDCPLLFGWGWAALGAASQV